MKKIWISGGITITALIAIGLFMDQIYSKENLFVFLGFGIGLIVLAIMVFTKRSK